MEERTSRNRNVCTKTNVLIQLLFAIFVMDQDHFLAIFAERNSLNPTWWTNIKKIVTTLSKSEDGVLEFLNKVYGEDDDEGS